MSFLLDFDLFLNFDLIFDSTTSSSPFSLFCNLESNTFKKSKLAACILSSVSQAHTSSLLEYLGEFLQFFVLFLWSYYRINCITQGRF